MEGIFILSIEFMASLCLIRTKTRHKALDNHWREGVHVFVVLQYGRKSSPRCHRLGR